MWGRVVVSFDVSIPKIFKYCEQLFTKIFLIPLTTVPVDGHLVVLVSIVTSMASNTSEYPFTTSYTDSGRRRWWETNSNNEKNKKTILLACERCNEAEKSKPLKGKSWTPAESTYQIKTSHLNLEWSNKKNWPKNHIFGVVRGYNEAKNWRHQNMYKFRSPTKSACKISAS